MNGRERASKGDAGGGRGGARERDIFDFEASICSLFGAVQLPLGVCEIEGRDASHATAVYVAVHVSSMTRLDRVTAASALEALWGFAFVARVFALVVVAIKDFALQDHFKVTAHAVIAGDRRLAYTDVRARRAPIRICFEFVLSLGGRKSHQYGYLCSVGDRMW